MRARSAVGAVAGGALLVAAWAAPAGAAEVTDDRHVDYTFTARNGGEVTCRVAGELRVARTPDPRQTDIVGAVSVTGDQVCHDSLLLVQVDVAYRRSDQDDEDTLSSYNDIGSTANVSTHLSGDVAVSQVRGFHGAAFRCLIDGSALICPTSVSTSTK